MKTERLFIADVEVGSRLRGITPEKVAALKASIADIGLRTPITVAATRDGDDWHFRLVAGAHRLAALRLLNEEFVDAYVMEGSPDDAELWEIDENFARAELSDAQRAEHHVRRETILKRRGVVNTKPGPTKVGVGEKSSLTSYAKQASEALGVSRRTVEKDLARGKRIAPEVLAEVAGTDLDKGVVLDQLAATPREDQPAKLASIRELRSAVRPAPDPLNDPEAHEKQLAALMSAWNRAAGPVREEFLLRIDRPVFDREGRYETA